MKILIYSLLFVVLSFASIDVEAGLEHFKVVNGDAGCEFIVKGSTRLTNYIPFVFQGEMLKKLYYGLYLGAGFSQQYTSPRARQFAYNHYGTRFDISLGVVVDDFEVIYTHSKRHKYEGANPDVLFFNSDVDSIKMRYKGTF